MRVVAGRLFVYLKSNVNTVGFCYERKIVLRQRVIVF